MKEIHAPKLILAGGSGFLGRELAGYLLPLGYSMVVLTRFPQKKKASDLIQYVDWDGKTLSEWTRHLEGAVAVVNLVGRSVNCSHTPKNRSEIIESRVNSVRVIGEAISRCEFPPLVWVQAGSLAIYGDSNDRICDEATAADSEFLAKVCLLWENAFQAADTPKTRKVLLRIGLVLSANDGFLKVLAALTRYGLGGTIGTGRQYISWLHIDDFNRMVMDAIKNDRTKGVYNVTSSNPVTNAEFMRALRGVLHRPWSPPVPVWAVRMGSWLMRTEACLALSGRRCIPRRFAKAGFDFKFTDFNLALEDLFTKKTSSLKHETET